MQNNIYIFAHSRSLEAALLVNVWRPFSHKRMERKKQARIYRKLYGYRSASNYGKYQYSTKVIPNFIPGDEEAERLKLQSV